MAQTDRALFLYGFDINNNNKYLNFRSMSGGPINTAIIPVGNYTLTEFLFQIKKQIQIADGINTYTVSVTRGVPTISSNQVTISTSGSYLDILFGSGPNAGNSFATLIGFATGDYTGAMSYTGYTNAGTILFPDYPIYDYIGADEFVMNDMSKSVSAAGIKETLVFSQMQFIEGNWKYINNFGINTQLTQWENFLKYAIKQLKFEFVRSVYEDVSLVYPVTLESTPGSGEGGGYKLNLMNKDGLYRFYETGTIKLRVIPAIS